MIIFAVKMRSRIRAHSFGRKQTQPFSPPLLVKVRALGYPRSTVILFYCLDPRFPGLSHVSALDVDGFLTNSESTRRFLLPSAPTALIPLAVDTEAFPFYPDPPLPAMSASDGIADVQRDGAKVVYVGAAGALEYKKMLAWMLWEAAPYGLDIYGSGWQDVPEFSGYWRGVLPEGDLVSGGNGFFVLSTLCSYGAAAKIYNGIFAGCRVLADLWFLWLDDNSKLKLWIKFDY